jgi:hypothetical protein|tara:strand:+ start:884 stop:1084 length:201 start_codon:yes stop_codon:yes gene_type:complete
MMMTEETSCAEQFVSFRGRSKRNWSLTGLAFGVQEVSETAGSVPSPHGDIIGGCVPHLRRNVTPEM